MKRRNFLKLISCLPLVAVKANVSADLNNLEGEKVRILSNGDCKNSSNDKLPFEERLLKEIADMTRRGFPPNAIWLNDAGYEYLKEKHLTHPFGDCIRLTSYKTMSNSYVDLPIVIFEGDSDIPMGRPMSGYRTEEYPLTVTINGKKKELEKPHDIYGHSVFDLMMKDNRLTID